MNDDLNRLPSIAPTRDDIDSRRRTTRRAEAVPRAGSSAVAVVTNVLLALLIGGLTAAGWFIVTQQEELEATRAELADAESRVRRIEERLSMTDQMLSQSDAETQDQLSFWESEIRKLWDVSNKRNRTWIEENRAAIASLDTRNREQDTSLNEVRSRVSEHARVLGTQDQLMEQLEILERRVAEMTSGQRDFTDRLNVAQQNLNALQARVGGNEEAVEAIDAFRRDVVARLTRLQERIDVLSGAAPAGGTISPQ